jgi:hypothetical protein
VLRACIGREHYPYRAASVPEAAWLSERGCDRRDAADKAEADKEDKEDKKGRPLSALGSAALTCHVGFVAIGAGGGAGETSLLTFAFCRLPIVCLSSRVAFRFAAAAAFVSSVGI